MDTNCIEEGRRLACEALRLTHRFGFIRPAELADALYEGRHQKLRLAQRNCARLLEDRFLLKRPFPPAAVGRSSVFVLSSSGAALVEDETGEPARSGKDLQFTSRSRHDLIANQAAARAIGLGMEVVTHREAHRIANQSRSDRPYLGKIPDLLTRTTAEFQRRASGMPPAIREAYTLLAEEHGWIAWEVENARKTGAARRDQAAWLAQVAANGLSWMGYQISGAGLAYSVDGPVNHRAAALGAVRQAVRVPVELWTLEAKLRSSSLACERWALGCRQLNPAASAEIAEVVPRVLAELKFFDRRSHKQQEFPARFKLPDFTLIAEVKVRWLDPRTLQLSCEVPWVTYPTVVVLRGPTDAQVLTFLEEAFTTHIEQLSALGHPPDGTRFNFG